MRYKTDNKPKLVPVRGKQLTASIRAILFDYAQAPDFKRLLIWVPKSLLQEVRDSKGRKQLYVQEWFIKKELEKRGYANR